MREDHSSLISFEAENLFYLFGSEEGIKKGGRKRAKDSQSLSLFLSLKKINASLECNYL